VVWAAALDALADDPVEATRKLQQALEQDPNNLPAIAALARHLARFGGAADAARILRQAAERNPEAAVTLEDSLRSLTEPRAVQDPAENP
jgi:Tfp pilus assembly protein PilF